MVNTSLLIAVALALFTALPAGATPSAPAPVTPAPVLNTASPANIVVQQYLTARNAGQIDQAYALLSPATQGMVPLNMFRATGDFPENPARDGMTPLLNTVVDLFLDTHNTSGYRYLVLGTLPDAPGTVLVRATAPSGAFLLKIATVPSPTGSPVRLDFMQSAARTDPEGFTRARQKAEQVTSLSNERQIGLGIIQYVQDHDETLPDADAWVDETMPYVKDEALFHDPSAPASQKWSYAYNRNLSHAALAHLDDPATTVMVFESSAGTKDASDTGQSVPTPGRHQGGTDYLFADGHAKLLPDGTPLSYLLSGK